MSTSIPFRDKIIPWYFVLFFVVVAAVNAVMVTLAVRSYSGLVTEHPYEKGLAYNQVVAAEAQQKALGWKSQLSYSPLAGESKSANEMLRDSVGGKMKTTPHDSTIASGSVSSAPPQGGSGRLHFILYDKTNAIIHPGKATATITRPAQQGMDFTVELNGTQTPIEFPAKGIWDVRVNAIYNGKTYQQHQRITVP